MSGQLPAADACGDDELVSVFVPAYNAARFIEETLRSILAQTHTRLEVVVLDDASTDHTATVVTSLADPRLRYIRNEFNLGQFRSMSRALELTHGAFVAIYHADDLYQPEMVAAELGFLQRHPEAGAVFTQNNIIDERGKVLATVAVPKEFTGRGLLSYDDVFRYVLRNKNQLLCCPTFMVKREVLATAGRFDAERYRIAADLDMWLRILRRCPVGMVPDRLVSYRRSTEQESSKYKRLRVTREEFFDIMDRYAALDAWESRLTKDDRREYGFHELDDETFRAANLVIAGRPAEARALLTRRFSWASLVRHPRRRKLRVLLLRTVMRVMLALGLIGPLSALVRWSEYGDRTGVSLAGTVGLD